MSYKKINTSFLKESMAVNGYSVSGLSKALGMSRSAMYRVFKNGEIEEKYIGKVMELLGSSFEDGPRTKGNYLVSYISINQPRKFQAFQTLEDAKKSVEVYKTNDPFAFCKIFQEVEG